MSNTVKPGDHYLHFKGGVYEIVGIAEHTESDDDMVVYKPVNSDKLYVRPAGMFFSPVDREKYPDVTQEMRFEPIAQEILNSCQQIK